MTPGPAPRRVTLAPADRYMSIRTRPRMSSLTPLPSGRAARPHDHLVVRVGAEQFAVPLAALEEAVEEPRVVALPGAPTHCLGVLRWRGRRVPLHDPAPAFGLGAAVPAPVALVFGGADPVAVVVDELLDVAVIAPEAVRPWSARGDVHGVIPGVTMIDGAIVAVVRPGGLVAACGAGASSSAAGASAALDASGASAASGASGAAAASGAGVAA